MTPGPTLPTIGSAATDGGGGMTHVDSYRVREMTDADLEYAAEDIGGGQKLHADARAELKRRDREYGQRQFDRQIRVARWSATAAVAAAVAAIVLAAMVFFK